MSTLQKRLNEIEERLHMLNIKNFNIGPESKILKKDFIEVINLNKELQGFFQDFPALNNGPNLEIKALAERLLKRFEVYPLQSFKHCLLFKSFVNDSDTKVLDINPTLSK